MDINEKLSSHSIKVNTIDAFLKFAEQNSEFLSSTDQVHLQGVLSRMKKKMNKRAECEIRNVVWGSDGH